MKAVCALVLICMLGVQGMPNPRLLRLLSLYKYNKEHGSGNHDHGEHCSGEHGSGSYGSGDHDHGEHGSGDHDHGEYGSGDHDHGEHGSGLEGSGSEGSGDHDHSERDGGSYGSGSYGSGSYGSGSYGSGSMGGPRAGGSMGGSMGGSYGSGSMGVPPAGGSMGGSMGVPPAGGSMGGSYGSGSMGVPPAGGSMGGSMGVPPAGGSMGGSMSVPPAGGSMGVPPAGGSMGGSYGSGSMGVPPAGGSMGGSYGSGSMGVPPAGGSMGGSYGSGSMGVPPAGGSMGGSYGSGSMGVPPAGGSMGGSMGVPPAGGSMGGSMGVPPAGGSMGVPPAGGSMGGSMGVPPAGGSMGGSMGVPPAGGSMGGSMGVPPAGGSMGGSMGVPPAGGSIGGSYGSGSMGGSMGVPPAGGSMGGLYGSGSMGVPPAGGSMGGPPMEPGLNAVMEQISNEFHALLDQYEEYMDKKLWEVPAFIPVQIAVHGVDLLDALNPACRKQFILDHLTGLTILALEMEKVDVGDKLVQFIESSPALSSAPVRDPAQAIRTGFQAVVDGVLDKIEEMKEEYGIVPTARIMQEGIEQLLSLPHDQLTVGALIEVFTGKILEHHLQLVARPCEDQDVVESFIGKLNTLAPEFTSEAVFSKLEEPLSSVLTGLDETHDGQITDLLNLFVVDFLQKVDEFMGALAEGDEPTLTLSFSMLGDLLTNIISAILEDGQYDFLQDYVEASVLQTVGAAIASPIDVEEMQALFLESFLKKLGEAGVDHATLSAALTTSFLETVSRLPVPQSIPVPL